jgi:DNA-binding NarL/FixJ family response regulator
MNHLATSNIGDEISLKLTPRQSQVLKLICHRGLSNKAIGNILKISESTVKIHTSAILKRYGVKNRTQLVLAYSNNLKA